MTVGDIIAIFGILVGALGFSSGASCVTLHLILFGGILVVTGLLSQGDDDKRPFFG